MLSARSFLPSQERRRRRLSEHLPLARIMAHAMNVARDDYPDCKGMVVRAAVMCRAEGCGKPFKG